MKEEWKEAPLMSAAMCVMAHICMAHICAMSHFFQFEVDLNR